MNIGKKLILSATAITWFGALSATSPIVLETATSRLVMELQGGAITVFESTGKGMNPLTWDSLSPGEDSTQSARQRGHFLCLDRWGPASEAEAALGMPPHGEASRVSWAVSKRPSREGEFHVAAIKAKLPKARLTVWRTVRLHAGTSAFHVTESVRNDADIGRIYNMVQHPSIAAPFLNKETVINCNAATGFPQSSAIEDPEQRTAEWPYAVNTENVPADIRRLVADDTPGVVSYVIDEAFGWITAHDPVSKTILGYVWKTSDYPWISLWRKSIDKQPYARGLEFGTTGLHRRYADLVEKGRILGRPLYNFIDAGDVQTYDYICFLVDLEEGFAGVQQVTLGESSIRLIDENGRAHEVPVGISLLRP